ncbi:hypothetical protein [Aneurinibacillus tyrosinisolvens]|uniref:hypothetical protein n=1 Tax=Aneurinibacillus tyrosinisolvens TaxID=1443435 RepID=UPI000A806B43|nr:hypothetical protein [Aneurinibacillus tyrosinisolvens]
MTEKHDNNGVNQLEQTMSAEDLANPRERITGIENGAAPKKGRDIDTYPPSPQTGR